MDSVSLHPLLQYYQHTYRFGQTAAIVWDLRHSPIPFARHAIETLDFLSPAELSQHATSPPITQLTITCGIFVGDWTIQIRNQGGVTLEDVLQAIFECLQKQVRKEEWEGMCAKQQDVANMMFDVRWKSSLQPLDVRSKGVLRVDCLLYHTFFAGLSMSLEVDRTFILTLRRLPKK
ncbi:ectomycorrhiza-regulated small secreted protein [Pluteus cervinus]|uniref:Ectomycorrhiza-regulated small secreted protein n=1 Tax=Pluteus cervinus TaxID=181527 RepID=A0ACD3B8L5_9AGAR|nr:ectomycorrhiza-regulated small secreted protein [Pluteus cervinus]